MAGVDGMRGGWVVAVVSAAGVLAWHGVADAAAVLAVTAGCAVVGVDIPLGLPAAGPRPCDLLARGRLGPARSSVFLAPVRGVLGAADDRVVEVHPELAFRAMAPGTGFTRKKTPEGAAQRISALGVSAEVLAARDDALGALAAAFSARRHALGRSEVLGGEPDPVTGGPMRIVV
ncbi:DUF429 domain-containing protein [Actinokineospora sp. G85]|uniref:DUF429 domain-containing protein n=1 Tax=Actinokineospora sp. G85 TaxID=3406626 RepID=UPI003C70C324